MTGISRRALAAAARHPRLAYLGGRSSTDPELRLDVAEGERVMVILDSDHSRDHVFAELERFTPLVAPGRYLIVEDTAVGGNPVERRFGPGPLESVDAFLTSPSGLRARPDEGEVRRNVQPAGLPQAPAPNGFLNLPG